MLLGDAVHLHPAVVDRVLPAAGRDHPADVAGGAAPGQVPPLHHDTRVGVHLRHSRGAKHTLQVFRSLF